jgi:hypothetical protein
MKTPIKVFDGPYADPIRLLVGEPSQYRCSCRTFREQHDHASGRSDSTNRMRLDYNQLAKLFSFQNRVPAVHPLPLL